MLTVARAGVHTAHNAAVAASAFHLFMFISFRVDRAIVRGTFRLRSEGGSEFMRAMRAEAHDVLQEDLVIGFVEAGFVARKL